MLRRLSMSAASTATRVVGSRYCSGGTGSASEVESTKVVGNPDRGVTDASASACTMTDIAAPMGWDGSSGRLAAGDLLSMMDVCAARTAMFHVTGCRTMQTAGGNNRRPPSLSNTTDVSNTDPSADRRRASIVTVAVDDTAFRHPVIAGDMLRLRGTVVHAGRSSLGVYQEVFRLQFPSKKPQLVCDAFFSMVAVNEHLKKAEVVPAVRVPAALVPVSDNYRASLADNKLTPVQRLQGLWASVNENTANNSKTAVDQCCDLVATVDANDPFRNLETSVNKAKAQHVRIQDTQTEGNRLFFPSSLNHNQTIFGGELLRWMEAHAVQCGRMFAQNKFVVSLGMHNVQFANPVYLTDWVTLKAHVVFVHHTTCEIDVELTVERESRIMTNHASFVLMSMDEIGQPREIQFGLDLRDADDEWRRKYVEAKCRYASGRLARARSDSSKKRANHLPFLK